MTQPFTPIGFLRSCFTEKFGVPRQSMMMTEARGILKLNPNPAFPAALNHLEKFSHIWVIFLFHKHEERSWRPTITPPRIDAPEKIGVFASRSPHRPNAIGLSAVRLEQINFEPPDGIELTLSGIDILDGTPVLDIKPYLPFADRIAAANEGWATGDIAQFAVSFSPESLEIIKNVQTEAFPRLQRLITQMLEWDPRPTSQKRAFPMDEPSSEGMTFAFRLLNIDVHWQIRQGSCYVFAIILK